MSATITIPADLEQRIAGVAAAQGKNLQEVAIEALDSPDKATLWYFDATEAIESLENFPARCPFAPESGK